MDPARLPPVINEVVQPKEERKEEPKEERKEEPKDAPKSVIVIHAKDIKPLDKELFNFWGKIFHWSEHYINIPFKSLPAHDYLFIRFVCMKTRNPPLTASDKSNNQCRIGTHQYHKNWP